MKKPVAPKDYIDAVDVPTTVELSAIGIVRSDYRERHGTPRQSTVGEKKRSRTRPTWFSTCPFSQPDAGVQATGSTR